MDSSLPPARFSAPIAIARPKGAPRFELWAPKLGRQLTLYDPLQVQLWALLESRPSVTAYCERPAYCHNGNGQQLIDFWVKAGRREACWRLTAQDKIEPEGALIPPSEIKVRYVCRRTLAARRIWIENWMRILPYLSANAGFVTSRLLDDIEEAASTSPTLGELEHDFRPHDIVLIRTAVFLLLHRGRIQAEALRVRPLDAGAVLRRPLRERRS